MANIQQGATPTHRFAIPFSADYVERAVVTYVQGGTKVVEKLLGADAITGDQLSVSLTQEETLAFDEKADVKIQLKVKLTNGKVLPSNVIYASVSEVLNKEVM